MSKKAQFRKQKNTSGFTLVELLVTLGIIVLVTGIVMVRYASFNSSVLLKSQAFITAFDLREAQSLAISVRGRSDQFYEEYGMYFDIDNPTIYRLFQDDDTNGIDDPIRYQSGEEIGVPRQLDPRFVIVDLCATNSVSRTCYTDTASMNNVAVTFKRPDFDADFYAADDGGSETVNNIQSVEVIFAPHTNSSVSRTVIVYATGQIDVQ